jgi:copper chaperone
MAIFHVPKMSCGGCANAILQALRQIDSEVDVVFDLPNRTVTVQSVLDEAKIAQAMISAGYTPSPV